MFFGLKVRLPVASSRTDSIVAHGSVFGVNSDKFANSPILTNKRVLRVILAPLAKATGKSWGSMPAPEDELSPTLGAHGVGCCLDSKEGICGVAPGNMDVMLVKECCAVCPSDHEVEGMSPYEDNVGTVDLLDFKASISRF